MDEVRVLLPISGISINQMEIDTVDEEGICGVCFTPTDIQRAYQRWKTMLGSPDPVLHEYTDPATIQIVQQLGAAEAEVAERNTEIETARARNLDLVREVSEREKDIRTLEASKTKLEADTATLEQLAKNREIEIKNLKKSQAQLNRRVERYQTRYRTADKRLNPVQRFVSWLFMI